MHLNRLNLSLIFFAVVSLTTVSFSQNTPVGWSKPEPIDLLRQHFLVLGPTRLLHSYSQNNGMFIGNKLDEKTIGGTPEKPSVTTASVDKVSPNAYYIRSLINYEDRVFTIHAANALKSECTITRLNAALSPESNVEINFQPNGYEQYNEFLVLFALSDSLHVAVLNLETMKLLYSSGAAYNDKDNHFRLIDVSVSEDGTATALLAEQGLKKSKDAQAGSSMSFKTFSRDGVTEVNYAFSEGFALGGDFETIGSELHFTGIILNSTAPKSPLQLLSLKVQPGSVTELDKADLSASLLLESYDEKSVAALTEMFSQSPVNPADYFGFNVSSVQLANGNRVHVFESYQHIDVFYRQHDLLLCCTDTKGQFTWQNKIPRQSQNTDITTIAGYTNSKNPDEVILIYNEGRESYTENGKQAPIRFGKNPVAVKEPYVIRVTVSTADGSFEKQPDVSFEGYVFDPSLFAKLTPNQVLLYKTDYKHREAAFGILTAENAVLLQPAFNRTTTIKETVRNSVSTIFSH